jgi:hypothetical protein
LVRKDWVVGTTEVPEISIDNDLHEGEGDNGPLKRNGYFERPPHLFEERRP